MTPTLRRADAPGPAPLWQPAHIALAAPLVIGALCLVLASDLPWLAAWPASWSLPATSWIDAGLGQVLEGLKPTARVFSWLMSFPMNWANIILTSTPWPLVIGAVTLIGWRIGGLGMAALGLIGLGFVLASGYWVESMNTLALVAVSVPLAVIVGGTVGIFANEFPRFRNVIQGILDVMQTVPTFAYLTPLLFLFGFGPVVGLIASAIYAAPPMARNVILGLARVEPEITEAAIMSGGTRLQQLFLVEIPAARKQIMMGVNQCLMAALSMVIIAAVIGGFNDIGWEVLLTMRKAQFGQSFLAGLVIVIFAVVIDRMSAALAAGDRHPATGVVNRRAVIVILVATAAVMLLWRGLPDTSSFTLFAGLAEAVDNGLGRFTADHGDGLDGIKNGAMFYVLLPMRIGLDEAVLPFTWGFSWTFGMSVTLYALALGAGGALMLKGRPAAGAMLIAVLGILETGIAQLPWPFVLAGAASVGWFSGGRQRAIFAVAMLSAILVVGLWERAMLSLYLCAAAVAACALVGGSLGLIGAVSPLGWRILRPVCDMLQTIPLFVFLIPVLMFFQIGDFSAFLAICAYAVVPMIRYTREGLVTTPPELVEAAISAGATPAQIMWEVRAPFAAPTILLGLNQTILYAFAMLVIAALIGTTGLGQSIFLALGQADIGLGIVSGAAMAILALVADRLLQGFADGRRQALGL